MYSAIWSGSVSACHTRSGVGLDVDPGRGYVAGHDNLRWLGISPCLLTLSARSEPAPPQVDGVVDAVPSCSARIPSAAVSGNSMPHHRLEVLAGPEVPPDREPLARPALPLPRTAPPPAGRRTGRPGVNHRPNVERVASLSMTYAVPPGRRTRSSSASPGSQPGAEEVGPPGVGDVDRGVGQRQRPGATPSSTRTAARPATRSRASSTRGGCGSTPTTRRQPRATKRGRWNPLPQPTSTRSAPVERVPGRHRRLDHAVRGRRRGSRPRRRRGCPRCWGSGWAPRRRPLSASGGRAAASWAASVAGWTRSGSILRE